MKILRHVLPDDLENFARTNRLIQTRKTQSRILQNHHHAQRRF